MPIIENYPNLHPAIKIALTNRPRKGPTKAEDINMNNFLNSATSRETSQQILDSIWSISSNSEIEAVRIWADPTINETIAIWALVTKNGKCSSMDFLWGENGPSWANYIEIPMEITS